ncbi:bifunctional phosphoribosyl-AMP cyclohydrolase/phosphoribosyl-ATP pyrophosphatase [Candidatus Aquiluna sp. IMCC13023]|jgi:phosphoribosyl-ATP pyrophosphohydrolase/phosphoribosyl-AMP cyclohydrolase|uniref:phosphoribosyl-AMP cyclohydrolase n=1 Tax=Candidatus Aquiluna sp. IMCC13023 TaxID=1081644 RepID=UPI00025B1BBB|nr:phosphoribosyl-AMP cyclohydrolase [Candidatus Aquiluna sp. IMCC13023]EIC91333.1 bifunctional phosphoribosyl-AMP cyclohydrolase/phosphoribosyl-ATP pyrophosphatase [Candidatus Aquiluna sp. IMCC13023]|tara:strand:+ start:906 stop:1226 length:321 start_codon:yes stop_codon:yes gene_type:complete
MRQLALDQVKFSSDQLIPVVIQDSQTMQVLMLAYANLEALEKSVATGQMHFYSRSRNQLWHKGETSGNTLAIDSLSLDCDGDTILAMVKPAGPTCHIGTVSCFEEI